MLLFILTNMILFYQANMLNELKAPFPEPHFTLQERIEHVALIKKNNNLQSKSFLLNDCTKCSVEIQICFSIIGNNALYIQGSQWICWGMNS